MKYLATIEFLHGNHSKEFPTVREAMKWLDSQNNNYNYRTTVYELNDRDVVVDWFVYTEGAG